MNKLVMVRGDSQVFLLTLVGLPDTGLADCDVWFTVEGLLAKRLDDGITVDDPSGAEATIAIEPGDTAGVASARREYPYDVQVQLPDGSIKTPVRGTFVVLPDVTRSS